MRGAPQVGFLATIRKINSRTSFGVCFLPTCVRMLEISLQYKRKPARCQRTPVSGVTNDEGLLPTRPDSPSNYPEEFIEEAEDRPWTAPLQHSELLLEREILQDEMPTTTKRASKRSQPEKKQIEQGPELYRIRAGDIARR